MAAISIFEDYSERMKCTFSTSYNGYILEFIDCLNRNFVLEGSFRSGIPNFTDLQIFAMLQLLHPLL
ncbi:MAG: hypothetical protein RRY33_07205, partial [Alistipes sp.]